MRKDVIGALIVGALAIALWWPHTAVYWFDSHERFDYVSRTVEYRDALARGELYPRWSPSFYGGYGSPFFNFYAPVVYWLGGALALATDSPTLALKLVVLLGSLLAGLGTFALVQLETKRADAATVAASLYLAAPYRLADVSWRGDIAEFLALGLLPLALWSYRRLARAEHARQLPARALLAVLVHALLVCTHTLTGLWGTGFVALVAALSIQQLVARRSLERAGAMVVTFGCALLASAIYTLPALREKSFVRIETMTAHEVAPVNNLIGIARLWNSGPMQTAPLLAASGALVLLAFLASALRKRRLPIAAALWLGAALSLVALTQPAAEPVWHARVIPFGDFIQFPWRLLGPASLAAAVALGLALAALIPDRRALALLGVPVVLGALALAWPQTVLRAAEADQLMLSASSITSGFVRGTSLDEYLPRAVTEAKRRLAGRVARSTADVTVLDVASDGSAHTLELTAARAAVLELRLHDFPGWSVLTERGPERVSLDASDQGLVRLRVPEPGHYRVQVAFGSTPTRDLACAMTWSGLLGVWPCVGWLAHRRVSRGRARAASVEPRRPALA